MNASKPLTAREKIAALRVTFLAQLPDRAQRSRKLFEQFKADPCNHAAAVELHRTLHSIKGTARSFGFRALGEAAAPGEDLAALLVDSPAAALPEDWQAQCAACLDSLDNAIAAASTSNTGDTEPGFTPMEKKGPVSCCGKRTIYICDDETLTLEQLASQLSCFGYEAVTFTDPQILYDTALTRRPDAVIMDINFPQGRNAGTEVMAKLQSETGKRIPTLFLSARDDFPARLASVHAGSDAYFRKPARAMDLVSTLDELTCQQQPEPYRILIIDDETEIAGYHGIILQDAGMTTYQLSEPARVLEALQEFRPDMVLMDMYMPGCNGHDLAKVIRQIPDYVGLPIVFLSSETDRKKQFSAMRIGAEGFLTKPVVPEELVAAVAIRAERMRTLRALMARDSLTGLFNHTTTTQLLESAIATTKRNGGILCFAMIDIDHFKLVNDTYGHPVGDQVILALSRALQQRLRNSDIVGRYGGEEFAVILQDVTLEHATRLLEELRQDFSRVIFHSADAEFSCTFSAGIAAYPAHKNMEKLREMADKALYRAKHDGRNRVVVDNGEQEQP